MRIDNPHMQHGVAALNIGDDAMSEKTVKDTCSQPMTPDDLSVSQIVQMHAGWAAAQKGLPLDMSNGPFWVEGWINYGWMRGGSGRSWLRH